MDCPNAHLRRQAYPRGRAAATHLCRQAPPLRSARCFSVMLFLSIRQVPGDGGPQCPRRPMRLPIAVFPKEFAAKNTNAFFNALRWSFGCLMGNFQYVDRRSRLWSGGCLSKQKFEAIGLKCAHKEILDFPSWSSKGHISWRCCPKDEPNLWRTSLANGITVVKQLSTHRLCTGSINGIGMRMCSCKPKKKNPATQTAFKPRDNLQFSL